MTELQAVELLEKMDRILSNQEILLTVVNPVGFASLTLIRWGIIIVPGILLTVALWWFFKQFIRGY